MRIQERIGIIATIIIVLTVLIFAISHEYFSNYLSDNLSNDNSDKFSLSSIVLGILTEMPIAGVVAYVVWYWTTSTERENRKYVRNNIATNYEQCWAISGALLNSLDHRNNINNLLDRILGIYKESICLMELHSHLLSADEIELYREEQDVINTIFICPLRQNSHNVSLLNGFSEFLRTQMVVYIRNYKVKEFY
jgi:hypothetical protein